MKKAFTLIELLVVIAVIALLSTLSVVALNSARAKSRDARRLSDIKQIQTALEMYFDSSGNYPTSLTAGSPLSYGSLVFLSKVPSDPISNNQYVYTQTEGGHEYTLDFILETKSADYEPGNYQATSKGILAGGGGSTPPAWQCGDNLVDDGQTYSTVENHNYCLMTASLNALNHTRRCFDDNEKNCTNYGALYGLEEGPDLCPNGWRLPIDKDYEHFSFLISGQSFIGYYDGKNYKNDTSYLMLADSYVLNVADQTISTLPADSAVSVRCMKDP
jgi:prepilin-type N-terminal cleavage/methylation domain-containing protein